MSIADQLSEGIGHRLASLYEEEIRLLERSGGDVDIGTAMDLLTAAMKKAYPKVDSSEIEGLVTHHVGKAMREARALSK